MKWGILGMPSKTSLLNKELILQISRGTGWISIIYFLGLLFALPLRTLMLYTENTSMGRTPIRVDSLFDFQYDLEIQIGLLIAIPVLMAVFLFRFLQVKQAVDLMHSLPIRREKSFPPLHFEWRDCLDTSCFIDCTYLNGYACCIRPK